MTFLQLMTGSYSAFKKQLVLS